MGIFPLTFGGTLAPIPVAAVLPSATSPYGTDVSTFPDLDPSFGILTGNPVLQEAILRRITTARGTLIDSPNYGTDVRAYLNEGVGPTVTSTAKAGIERECKQEERIASAQAAVAFNAQTQTMAISISIVGAGGPFTLLLNINGLNSTILQGAH